jgi:hypothetical protein
MFVGKKMLIKYAGVNLIRKRQVQITLKKTMNINNYSVVSPPFAYFLDCVSASCGLKIEFWYCHSIYYSVEHA